MKEKGYSHLNINCENILLDINLTAKLSGFEFSQENSEGINIVTRSEHYRAPEIWLRQFPYDGEKADVFSLAVVLFAIQMNLFPFEKGNVIESHKYKAFNNGVHIALWANTTPVSEEFKDLF